LEREVEMKRNFSQNKKEPTVEPNKEFESKLAEKDQEISNYSEQVKTKDAEIERLNKELETERKQKRTDEFNQFADQLVTDGKLLPANKAQVVELMEVLSTTAEYEFSEGGKTAPVQVFKTLMNAEKTAVEFSEIAKDGQSGAANHDKMEKLIREEMDKNKMSYSEAFSKVQKDNPDLASAYQAEIG